MLRKTEGIAYYTAQGSTLHLTLAVVCLHILRRAIKLVVNLLSFVYD